jgi:hypothetical protein
MIRNNRIGHTRHRTCVFGGERVAHLFSFLCCVFGGVRVAHLFSFLCFVFGGVRVAHLFSWGTEHQYLFSGFLGVSILQLLIIYRIYDYDMLMVSQ